MPSSTVEDTSLFTISSHYGRSYIAAFQRYSKQHINLKKTGVNEAILQAKMGRLPAHQFDLIIQHIAQQCNDEAFALCPPLLEQGSLRLFNELAIDSINVGDFMEKAVRYFHFLSPHYQLSLQTNANLAFITVNPQSDFSDQKFIFTELLLLFWHRFLVWLCMHKFELQQVDYAFAEPVNSAETHLLFGCPCTFSQPINACYFDKDILLLPIKRQLADLDRADQKYLSQLYSPINFGRAYSHRVRFQLERHQYMQQPFPNFEDMAAGFNIATQTLRRRLKAEFTSYQLLKDELRRDYAIHLLVNSDTPLHNIAQHLQLSEPSAFSRAFKQWTGVNPALYRQI